MRRDCQWALGVLLRSTLWIVLGLGFRVLNPNPTQPRRRTAADMAGYIGDPEWNLEPPGLLRIAWSLLQEAE